MLTIKPPGWYAGMPDQPAAAGLPDLRMFSSLNLRAVDAITEAAAKDEPGAAALRRALGVDVVATFDAPCPGTQVATLDTDKAAICRDEAAARPPYWIPLAAATPGPKPGSPLGPRDAALDVETVLATAVSLDVASRDDRGLRATVDAPADGWVWIDRAWWPGWTTSVDGQAVETLQALGGQLVPVPAGTPRGDPGARPVGRPRGAGRGDRGPGRRGDVGVARPQAAHGSRTSNSPGPSGPGEQMVEARQRARGPRDVSPWARRRS